MAPARWLVLLGALAIGFALTLAAPDSWRLIPYHGLLLGAALYAGALRRYAARPEFDAGRRLSSRAWAGHAARLFLRAALFAAMAAVQGYVCFEIAPGADLRATFVILSSWIVLESVVDAGNAPRHVAERC